MASGKHTILLIQKTADKRTKTYQDFDTVSNAMNALCQMFEQRLQSSEQRARYDVGELLEYIRGMTEVCALVFDPAVDAYRPHNKEWVCSRLYAHLKSAAAKK